MAETLTEKQEDTLRVLREQYRLSGGWPVTIRQLTEALGRDHHSPVYDLLRRLEAAGLVERNPRPGTALPGWRPVDEP